MKIILGLCGFGFERFKKKDTCWAYIYDWKIRLGFIYILKEHILTLYEKRVLKRNEIKNLKAGE